MAADPWGKFEEVGKKPDDPWAKFEAVTYNAESDPAKPARMRVPEASIPADERPGFAASMTRRSQNAIMLGFGDEARAMASYPGRRLRAALKGEEFDADKSYELELAKQRTLDDMATKNTPYIGGAGELASGLTFGVPGKALQAAAPVVAPAAATAWQGIKEGAKNAAKMLPNTVPVGAAFGAAHGFGSGENSFEDRLTGAMYGGAGGAAVGAALPFGFAGASGLYNAGKGAWQHATGRTPAQARAMEARRQELLDAGVQPKEIYGPMLRDEPSAIESSLANSPGGHFAARPAADRHMAALERQIRGEVDSTGAPISKHTAGADRQAFLDRQVNQYEVPKEQIRNGTIDELWPMAEPLMGGQPKPQPAQPRPSSYGAPPREHPPGPYQPPPPRGPDGPPPAPGAPAPVRRPSTEAERFTHEGEVMPPQQTLAPKQPPPEPHPSLEAQKWRETRGAEIEGIYGKRTAINEPPPPEPVKPVSPPDVTPNDVPVPRHLREADSRLRVEHERNQTLLADLVPRMQQTQHRLLVPFQKFNGLESIDAKMLGTAPSKHVVAMHNRMVEEYNQAMIRQRNIDLEAGKITQAYERHRIDEFKQINTSKDAAAAEEAARQTAAAEIRHKQAVAKLREEARQPINPEHPLAKDPWRWGDTAQLPPPPRGIRPSRPPGSEEFQAPQTASGGRGGPPSEPPQNRVTLAGEGPRRQPPRDGDILPPEPPSGPPRLEGPEPPSGPHIDNYPYTYKDRTAAMYELAARSRPGEAHGGMSTARFLHRGDKDYPSGDRHILELVDEIRRQARAIPGKLEFIKDGKTIRDKEGPYWESPVKDLIERELRKHMPDDLVTSLMTVKGFDGPGMRQMIDFRTSARYMDSADPMSRKVYQTWAPRVEAALTKDIEARLGVLHDKTALTQWQNANRQYAALMENHIKPLKPILGENVRPEQAFDRLLRATQEKGGDLNLIRAYSSAHASGRQQREGAGALIAHSLEGGVETFVTNWRKMSHAARSELFKGDAAPLGRSLDKLVKLAEPGLKMSETIGSRPHALNIHSGATAITFVHNWAAGATMMAGQYGLARMMARPAYVDWLTRAARVQSLPSRSAEWGPLLVRAQAISQDDRENGKAFLANAKRMAGVR